MSPHEVIIVVLVVAALAIALPIAACEARLRRMYGDDSARSRRNEWDGEVR
nr:MAG TPA: hypothetical protein [Caudoviricetes sp.]